MAKNEGLYQKFDVKRRDGRDAPGNDREDAAYFVLDVAHDPFARAALAAYMIACEQTFPTLADELDALLSETRHGRTSGPLITKLRTP